MTQSHLTDRRGAALATVMLLVFLLMISVAGAFTRTSAERRVVSDATAQVDAYTIAATGIDQYLSSISGLPGTLPDARTYDLPGGKAYVTLRAVRLASTDSLLVLVSRGENTSTNRYSSTAAPATRTVTQLIRWTGGTLDLPAAFTSLSGFDKNGTSGALSGIDACSTAPAPLASIPGVAVPSVSAANTSPWYTGQTSPIDGDPNDLAVAIGTPGTTGTAKDAIDIDWSGITARTAITPNYFYKTTTPTSGSWPTSTQLGGTNYPVTFVQGDLTLPSDGQGILIVTGDLTVNGSETWHGIILVGGTITSNGTNSFFGAIATGLNVKLGQTVGVESIGNGTKTFQYNSCDIKKALQPFGSWTRMGNAWTDNYPIY